jgi:predicted neuraminidase
MLSFCIALAAAFGATSVDGEFIFPPNAKHNHGSSIVETPQGDLIAVWFHGSGERTADDVQVQGARLKKGESEWGPVWTAADTPNLPDCNPVLYIMPDKKLWLFWVAIQANEWGSALLMSRYSSNYEGDGAPEWDWQAPIHTEPVNLIEPFKAVLKDAETALAPFLAVNENLRKDIERGHTAIDDKLTRRLGWMTRTAPLALQNGRVLLGLYSDVFNCSLAAYTDDNGATWHTSEPILDPRPNMISNVQPGFVQKKNGDVVAYMRDNGIPKYVRTSVSHDNGVTWGPVELVQEIRESGASVASLALASGNWVLLANDLIDGRHRLTMYLSEDEGASWKYKRALEEVEEDGGSFSYPCLIQGADGRIHATYSFKRKDVEGSTIKHVALEESWVRGE